MQWFESWFDSHFYHKLYFERDEQEAKNFIKNLIEYLQPAAQSFMLDVACGKGRHSKTLSSYGHTVTGIDISPQSIAFAKKYENDRLEFYQHDMRLTYRINYYQFAFNLFTSFGYFNTQRENDDAIRTIAQSIKPDGTFVIDYLNQQYVADRLIPSEIKEIEGTTFRIKRYKENGFFIKQIQIEDASLSVPLIHQEKVAAFTFTNFEQMFKKQGLVINAVFGNYQLQPFDINSSPRLIIVAQKKI